jgi:hypothetical protein
MSICRFQRAIVPELGSHLPKPIRPGRMKSPASNDVDMRGEESGVPPLFRVAYL